MKPGASSLLIFWASSVLKEILQIKEYTPIDVLNYIKMLDSFPNICIVYRILLTILVAVAFADWSFWKLKLIQSYLRSTMSQKKFSRLAILSIEERDVRRTWIQKFN